MRSFFDEVRFSQFKSYNFWGRMPADLHYYIRHHIKLFATINNHLSSLNTLYSMVPFDRSPPPPPQDEFLKKALVTGRRAFARNVEVLLVFFM